MSQTMANRYAKFFPQAVLPEVGCSVYLNANILVLGDLTPLIREFVNSGADIGLFPHRERSTLAEEFEFCRRVGKSPPPTWRRASPSCAATARPGCPPTPRSPRTLSSSAATAARSSPRQSISGGRSSRTIPSATS